METKYPKPPPTETALTVIRVATLLALGMVVLIGVMGEPYDTDSDLVWMFEFWASKAVAVTAGYAAYRLHRRWVKTDKWLAAWEVQDKRAYNRDDNWL